MGCDSSYRNPYFLEQGGVVMIKNIKGAIFDFDGTILDSMPMWYSLYGNYLKEAGLELSDDLADFFHHATIPMAAERFSQGIIPRTKEKIEEETELKN